MTPAQLDLFAADQGAAAPQAAEAAYARSRMREMIDRLRDATVPPWKDHMGAILDDGAFQRAMRLVPPEEAQALWAEFDLHMERLWAVWAEANLPPEPPEG